MNRTTSIAKYIVQITPTTDKNMTHSAKKKKKLIKNRFEWNYTTFYITRSSFLLDNANAIKSFYVKK